MDRLRPLRGFALLIALLALAAGAKAVLYDTLDPDLFWHLRVADELARQPFPHALVDDLSFASSPAPWTPYSWLADLGMKKLWDFGGYRAAVIAQALMAGTLVVFISLSALELSIARFGRPRYLAAGVAGFVGAFLSLPYLSFRPVTAALALLAIAAWLLQRDRRMEHRSRAVWLLIPLTALLINIHLYAIFVPLAVAGLLTRTRRWAMLLAGTIAACLLTPMLPGVIQTAWNYQFTDVMVSGHVIAEMQPFYRGQLGWISAALVLTVLAAAGINRRQLRLGDWMWLAFSVALLVRLGRFSPIFGIFAAPTLAITLPAFSDVVLSRRTVQGLLAFALILGGVRVGRAFPPASVPLSTWINRMGGNSGYPTGAADYVLAHIPARTHRLISEFTWGGYLEWRLGSDWRVLMDGRTQLYSTQFWQTLYLGPVDQRKAYLATIAADAAVVPSAGSEFRQSLLDLGWKTVWSDQRADVLVPPPAITSTKRTGQYAAARDNAS
jgi:hypothetical protein